VERRRHRTPFEAVVRCLKAIDSNRSVRGSASPVAGPGDLPEPSGERQFNDVRILCSCLAISCPFTPLHGVRTANHESFKLRGSALMGSDDKAETLAAGRSKEVAIPDR